MKSAKIKRFGLAFCLLAALFASSISACTCLHHPETFETDASSCHRHSENADTGRHDGDDSNEASRSILSPDECCCIEPAPKVFAKSETLKIEKQALAVMSISTVQTGFKAQTASVEFEFVPPFYLTDSFYNLTPGRAPPGL